MAVYRNNVGIVRSLLDVEHLDVNASDHEGITPLLLAASEGYAELVRVLLQSGVIDVNARMYNGWTALTRAVY
jgi:ankyrin repeat protein